MMAALKGNLRAGKRCWKRGLMSMHRQERLYTFDDSFSPRHIEIVRVFLEKGADVNAKSYWGNKASTMASKKGHTQIAELLKAREEMSARQVMILGT